MTFSAFSYKLRVLLISCGAINMKGVDDFILYSYRRYINPHNKETYIDKRNMTMYQRILLKISMRMKYNEYEHLITSTN